MTEKVINSKIYNLIGISMLIFFLNISSYSLFFDVINGLTTQIKDAIYWGIHTSIVASLFLFIRSLTLSVKLRMLCLFTSIFVYILAIFQILYCLEILLNEIYWVIFCPSYIVLLLIIYKCQQPRNL